MADAQTAGQARRLAAMVVLFFLVVCAVGILRPIKNALALDGLGATDFYKVYLVSAAVVLFVPPYNRLADRFTWRSLIPAVALFFALNLVAFRVFYREGSASYGMLFYGWYDLFAAALVTQFFMATQFFFNARSAKGAYPLVIAGGAIGASLGGAITGFFAEVVGTPNLLLVAATLIAIFALGLPFVWGSEPAVAAGSARVAKRQKLDTAGFRELVANPQVRLIAASVLLTVLVKQLIDYQFNTITKEAFVTRDAISAFQGKFNAATQWLPMVVVLALRPLLKRWGIGLAVFLLPMFMLFTTLGIAIWWSLATVVAAKAAETSLRYSAERTGREILYVPVPEDIKLKAKAYIDVAIEKGLGKVASAGLIFLLLLVMSYREVAYVAFALSALWVAAAVGVRREYVRTLAHAIQGRFASLKGISASLSDASTLPVVQQALAGGDTLQTAFALDLVDQSDSADVRPLAAELHRLLEHPIVEIRERALRTLARLPEAIDTERVRGKVTDPAPSVREAAVHAICVARPAQRDAILAELLDSDQANVRTATLACLVRGEVAEQDAAVIGRSYIERWSEAARAGAHQARVEIALAAGIFRADPNAIELLEPLIRDGDPEVAAASLRSAGLLGEPALYPRMIEALRAPATREAARDALVQQDRRAVRSLAEALLDERGDPIVRRTIPGVLARIPARETVDVLLHSLLAPETDQLLDFRTLKALNKLRTANPDLGFEEARVRSAITREVAAASHYATASAVLAEEGGDGPRVGLLCRALEEAWRERREGTFRCLGLLYEPEGMYRCYLAVISGEPVPRANALEWLEQTVGYQVFTKLSPVLEPKHTSRRAPARDDLLAELCADGDAWVARCAAAAVKELGGRRPGAGAGAAAGGKRRKRAHPHSEDAQMELIEKVFLLQGVDLLQGARSAHLALLASIAEEIEVEPGAELLRRGEPTDAMHVVIRGTVELEGVGGQSLRVQDGTAFGTWALIDVAPSLVSATTVGRTKLLRIARLDFYDLLADHPELSMGLLQGLARRIRTLVA